MNTYIVDKPFEGFTVVEMTYSQLMEDAINNNELIEGCPELNAFYGKTHSEESRSKMSSKAKINSNTKLGRNQRSKNGKKAKGKKWWNNGTSHKRSEKCPGREWVAGRINLIGTPHTHQAKEKMKKIRKEYWEQKKGA
jgi:hypothetical protein